jgi:hypothetical protein
MSDDNDNPAGTPVGDGEPDEPIRELLDLEREPSPGFLERVRRKIYRRSAVSHVATFSWHLPKVILIELVSMLGHVLNAFSARKGNER